MLKKIALMLMITPVSLQGMSGEEALRTLQGGLIGGTGMAIAGTTVNSLFTFLSPGCRAVKLMITLEKKKACATEAKTSCAAKLGELTNPSESCPKALASQKKGEDYYTNLPPKYGDAYNNFADCAQEAIKCKGQKK